MKKTIIKNKMQLFYIQTVYFYKIYVKFYQKYR